MAPQNAWRRRCVWSAAQTNKVKEAVALFDVIQTLDREKLARKLAELKGESGFPRLLIQVNTGTSRKNPASHPLN